jgi:hypothetical protein
MNYPLLIPAQNFILPPSQVQKTLWHWSRRGMLCNYDYGIPKPGMQLLPDAQAANYGKAFDGVFGKAHDIQEALRWLEGKVLPSYYQDKYEEERIITEDTAELLLNLKIDSHTQLQRFFATGSKKILGKYVPNGFPECETYIEYVDLWNLRGSEIAIEYSVPNNPYILPWSCMISQVPFFINCPRPLLKLACYYDHHQNTFGMARKICNEFGVHPLQGSSDTDFGITVDSKVQFSLLNNQYCTEGTSVISVYGDGGEIYYHVNVLHFPHLNKVVLLPIRFVCHEGHALGMPMYIPPDTHHFLNEPDLMQSAGKLLLMSSNMILADSCRHHGSSIISAWNLKDNLERLPWEKLRGKTVHYLLLSDESNLQEELDLAIAVCAKIRDAGYGHPRIIDCNGNQINPASAKVYDEQQFGELVEKHGQTIDLRGFPDYAIRVEMTGCEETAVPYISTKNLFVILGERKAGKSWMVLWYLLLLAFTGKKPAKVLYLHGEDESIRIAENIAILKRSMRISEDNPGKIIPINLAMAACATVEGFDLKDPQCGAYLLGLIDKEHAAEGPKLVAVALDNYATLMGKQQSGDHAAVPALNLLAKIQQKGVAVLLACHTNAEFNVAGSIQIGRRANGIMRVTKNPMWKDEILRKLPKQCTDKEMESDQKLTEIFQGIHRKFTQEDTVVVNVAFESFRSKKPRGFEWVLECKKNELRITEESEEQQLAYVQELTGMYPKCFLEPDNPPLAKSNEQCESAAKDDRESVEFTQQGLSELVKLKNLQTRGELAEYLGLAKSTIDTKMQKCNLINQSIGLQSRRGRPNK